MLGSHFISEIFCVVAAFVYNFLLIFYCIGNYSDICKLHLNVQESAKSWTNQASQTDLSAQVGSPPTKPEKNNAKHEEGHYK